MGPHYHNPLPTIPLIELDPGRFDQINALRGDTPNNFTWVSQPVPDHGTDYP